MKHFYTFLLSTICLSAPGYSQIDTVQTHAFPGIKNWDEVVAKATADNKCIMVDLSTEWCYWCKVMDKKQFRDTEILALMNPKLNSYMLDAEKDSIGQLLKLKFGIATYPSFLFFTPHGEFLETWAGSMPKNFWIQYIKDSIDKVPIPRPGIPAGLKFEWPSFVERELKAEFKKSTPSEDELSQFFAQCDYKKFTDFNICRFYPNDVPDNLLEKMIQDRTWLDANYGKDMCKAVIETSINWKGYRQTQNKNWAKASGYINRYSSLFPENAWELFLVKLFYFENKIEVDSIIMMALQHDSFVYDYTSDKLVEFLIENGKTESHFKQANLWNSRELKKEVNFNRAKHQAQIAMKLSDMNQAKVWATAAIDAAAKEELKFAAEDQWIIYLSKGKSSKNSG